MQALSNGGQVISTLSGAVCEVIDFNAFQHGDPISSVSVFGMNLDVSVERYLPDGGTPDAQAFDSDLDGSTIEDKDLVYTNGFCTGCNGLNQMLVIPDLRTPFSHWGDTPWGGEVTFSGFTGGPYYVDSYTTVDRDESEPAIRLFADGTLVGQTTTGGNGVVESVPTTPHSFSSNIVFYLGTETQDNVTGSGAIDNIRICRVEEGGGDEGCTLGYWKNHTSAWAGYAPGQTLESVFEVPDAYNLDDYTFLQALDFNGGPGSVSAARLLLKQAVAALLNAAHPDVSYELTQSQIISQVNAALATGNRNTMLVLKDQLDGYNNAGCPL